MTIARVAATALPHVPASPARYILGAARLPASASKAPALSGARGANLIKISLERSLSADVQSHTMGPAAKKFRVPQFERDDIETFLLQKPYE